jgi:hypothetical protein
MPNSLRVCVRDGTWNRTTPAGEDSGTKQGRQKVTQLLRGTLQHVYGQKLLLGGLLHHWLCCNWVSWCLLAETGWVMIERNREMYVAAKVLIEVIRRCTQTEL